MTRGSHADVLWRITCKQSQHIQRKCWLMVLPAVVVYSSRVDINLSHARPRTATHVRRLFFIPTRIVCACASYMLIGLHAEASARIMLTFVVLLVRADLFLLYNILNKYVYLTQNCRMHDKCPTAAHGTVRHHQWSWNDCCWWGRITLPLNK